MTNNNSQLWNDRYYKNGNKDYDCLRKAPPFISAGIFSI